MIIKELCLHNFGVYAGDNRFTFRGKKPVVLIGGLNGRGKTTFLEAVLLALYGKNSFAYDETGHVTYGQYLRSYVNESDGSLECYIELEFVMRDEEAGEYRIRREWNAKKKRTSETIIVYKDGEKSQFLTDNWSMFIENVLPSGLSNFFFFDGEKIAELAVERTNSQMKESIKILLGITVLDHLDNDLNRIISRTTKNKVEDKEAIEIERLRAERDEACTDVSNIEVELGTLMVKLDETRRKLDKANEAYIAKGGDIVTQRQQLIEQRSDARAKLDIKLEELVSIAGSELPLVLVKQLLQSVRDKAEVQHDKKVMQSALSKMYGMLDGYLKKTGADRDATRQLLDYFSNHTSKKNASDIISLSDAALSQIQSLLDLKLKERISTTEEAIDDRDILRSRADQLDSYLSVDIDEKAIAKSVKKIKQYELEIAETEAKMELLEKKRKEASGVYKALLTEFNKKVESYLKRVELNDDGERIIKYSNIAKRIIEKYRVELQREKSSEVADTMTKCYKMLANKKTLIERIEMNPETLDLIYINKEEAEVPRKSLSAGEKQLMVIALLWALAICSKKRLPVIIDTPLSRLDSMHRKALVKTYFPKASDQTIILSTDSEIDRDYYDMMKKNIDDEYTLVYDDKSKSTSIVKGYFAEAGI